MHDVDEHCDDGSENGEELGDCAPDCSAYIHQAVILVTSAQLGGDFAGTLDPVGVADGVCQTEFGTTARAMFSHGASRRATLTPFAADSPIDWVLEPWTRYVNDAGSLVWLTDTVPLLGVRDRMRVDLLDSILPVTNSPVITGMRLSWQTLLIDDCTGWSSPSGSMAQGNPFFLDSFLQLFGTSTCSNSRAIYCILP